ncbi:MAG: hypothetical protein WBA84_05625 [Carnobacterium sp.]|uniref:hypothetical protein n=1 Tax=Carnobacterium sp. TaxID=48221 RepID=UPI003C7945AA
MIAAQLKPGCVVLSPALWENEKLPQEAIGLEDTFEFSQRARARNSTRNKMRSALFRHERKTGNGKEDGFYPQALYLFSECLERAAQLKTT